VPGITICIDLDDWDACAMALGGMSNTLAAGLPAKLGERMRRRRAGDGAVTLQLPMRERAEGDTRAMAVSFCARQRRRVPGNRHLRYEPTFARMYRASGQAVPVLKRILELNPKHPPIFGPRQAHKNRLDDPALAEPPNCSTAQPFSPKRATRGPGKFAGLLADRLARTVGDATHAVRGFPSAAR
jgi:hypothetical protein